MITDVIAMATAAGGVQLVLHGSQSELVSGPSLFMKTEAAEGREAFCMQTFHVRSGLQTVGSDPDVGRSSSPVLVLVLV